MQLADLDTTKRYRAQVVSTERITPEASDDEIRELVLDVTAPDLELKVGQSVGVLAPGQKQFGQDYHLRLYSVSDLPENRPTGPRIKITVKRCHYIDDYSGERYEGVASNYLCDLHAGDELTLTGPHGLPFQVPLEKDANLILIATSTGIAPFRAFVRHLYEDTEFEGRIWLFYGAKSGLDVIYLNEKDRDFAQYYDKPTFQAFQALSPRPHFDDAIDWGDTLAERGQELWKRLSDAKTYVYVAGLEEVAAHLDQVFAKVADSPELWKRRKAEMRAGKRWVELLY